MNLSTQLQNMNQMDAVLNKLVSSGNLSSSLKDKISRGHVRLLPATRRIRKAFSGAISGKVALLENSQDEIVGVSDFQGQKIQDGEAIIATASAFRYVQATAGNLAKANFSPSLPKELLSARLVTKSSGNVITEDSGIDFHVKADISENGADKLNYSIPRFYGDGQSIEVELEFSPNSSLATPTTGNEHMFEYVIYGFVTQYK